MAQDEALKALGVRIVGIDYKDDPANTRKFLAQDGNPYAAIGDDLNGRVGIDWGSTGVPETYIIRGDGTIAFKYTGPITERALQRHRPAGNRKDPALKIGSRPSMSHSLPASFFYRSQPLTAKACGPLRGKVRPPGDKSISHRAFLLGLLTTGETRVEGLLEGEDVLNTGRACAALGAKIERHGEGKWSIFGAGLGSLLEPRETLDFGNAGTGSRLMMGVTGGHGISARFDGDASLRKRPMRRILDPLVLMGAQVLEQGEGGRCPILLKGTAEPAPIEYRTPVASAQIKSAVLLAGLNALGRTTVIETEASRDHTEKMLAFFGAELRVEPFGEHGRKITLEGRPRA